MRTTILVLALLMLAGVGYGQTVYKYRVPLVQAEIDTVPGTDASGGSGKAAWLYVGDSYVSATLTSQDSVNVQWAIDYADSGWSSASMSSNKNVGFKTVTYAASTDSMCTAVTAEWPTHHGILKRQLRSVNTDVIPGGAYIRFRITVPDVADVMAGVASDATVTLRVHVIPRYR